MPADWRTHYTQLCKEGETLGHTFNDLSHYISQRMTDQELRAMLREFDAGPRERRWTPWPGRENYPA